MSSLFDVSLETANQFYTWGWRASVVGGTGGEFRTHQDEGMYNEKPALLLGVGDGAWWCRFKTYG